MSTPSILETQAEWRRADVADADAWTEHLTGAELRDLDQALRHARARSSDLLDIGKEDFALPVLGPRLRRIESELIDGRGFVLIRGIPRAQYDNDEMCLLYWGVGMHLGKPWPQNKKGHVLGDVTDQGKRGDEPDSRGNEIGGIAFPYHSDGSDLVGLMCLQTAKEGGTSTVCNAVAIHNDLVRSRPELAAALYEPQPYDFRGEEPTGGKGWYAVPVFTEWDRRLFVRYIRPYILASQRHADAPRIAPLAEKAMQAVDAMTQDPDYNVFMDFEPGDMQFVNNYHVLHARTAYVDDRASGRVRHLKRLWLETETLESRPSYFRNDVSGEWGRKRVISRLDAVN
ncbi:MAG TPA: TauD/TfdA family dioxygenase [Candidatus Binatia bacterium]|nr:TauD/TfdA family dioxygenase [Candidatus Binatia bacterium]